MFFAALLFLQGGGFIVLAVSILAILSRTISISVPFSITTGS